MGAGSEHHRPGSVTRDSDTAFIEITQERLPLRIEAISEATGEVVWEALIEDAGALTVPGLRHKHGPVGMRITDGLGTCAYVSSNGEVA